MRAKAGTGAAVIGAVSLVFNPRNEPLLSVVGLSILGFIATFFLVPALGPLFVKRGFSGRDLSKHDKPLLPETMGAILAMVYLIVILLFLPFPFYKHVILATSGGGNRDQLTEELEHIDTGRVLHRFPHNKLAEYLSAILSLQSMMILGVADDLFDIRWRHKLFLPALAAIPMLVVYFVDFGVTKVVVPIPLRPYLGSLVDIGLLYYIYMGAVAIFCPNAVNILAGVNGLEVGQCVVIAISIIFNDCLYLFKPGHPATDSHLFSIYLLVPFVGVSLALLYHNWYPARVFVGDTYCYFAGMVFVVVGILGHFSKTLLLFFVPQILNFLYSAPQLFNLMECPRHRLPKLDPSTGLLEPSRVRFSRTPTGICKSLLLVMEKLHLVRLWRDEASDIIESSNLTIINLMLVQMGPLREDYLCRNLLISQALTCVSALVVRHQLALLVFTEDN